ncbi:MAG: PKD domain-containing protein [Bacteroidota bacterium]
MEDITQETTIDFTSNNFPLRGPISQLGLPNFIQQISNGFGGPDFTFAGLCFGDSTKFTGTATDQIDQFTWTFGDGLSKPASFEPDAAHLYAAAGIYNVTMQITNRCNTVYAPIIKPVEIFTPPAKPTIPLTDVLCNGPVILDANKNNVTGLTFLWSDQTTVNPHAPINEQSIVSVKATDTHGCSASAETLIADNRPQVELGPDQTLCQNTTVAPLDPHNPAFNVTWTVDGVDVYTGLQKHKP